jgi:hypothetical protein
LARRRISGRFHVAVTATSSEKRKGKGDGVLMLRCEFANVSKGKKKVGIDPKNVGSGSESFRNLNRTFGVGVTMTYAL